jgi:NADH-quinone oxidoreductase subunit G
MLKQNGEWRNVDWQTALNYAAHAISDVVREHGPDALGALVSPASTLEEMALVAALMRSLGSDNVDFRLRHADFRADGKRRGVPWLGMSIADVGALDRILLVGSFLRKDQPLLSARIRAAAKKGTGVSLVHVVDEELLMPVVGRHIVAPSRMVSALAEIAAALADAKSAARPNGTADLKPGEDATRIAADLAQGRNVGILLGNFALQHSDTANIHAWAQEIARLAAGKLGILGEAANSVGGYLAGAKPQTGANARSMLEQPRQAYLLFNVEPELDCGDPRTALAALSAAKTVIAMTPYRHRATEYADVLLPIAPFTETAGTFVNCEGRVQIFNGVVPPLAEARPGWKVLRVLGNMLQLEGFDFASSETVRDLVLGDRDKLAQHFDNGLEMEPSLTAAVPAGIERIADVPMYQSDMIVRRAVSLQQTPEARRQRATMNAALARELGLVPGEFARLRMGEGDRAGEAVLSVDVDDRIPDRCIRVPAALPTTAGLGPMTGIVTVERMPAPVAEATA